MTHQSEERLPDSEPASARAAASARILQFERPQSELQRAIQMRAQEAMDLDRDRDREVKKPNPLKWIVIFLIALIPVVLIFAAVDGFLRAFQRINESYKSAPAPVEQPAVVEQHSSEPGVVLLQPYDAAPAGEAQQQSAPQSTAPVASDDASKK